MQATQQEMQRINAYIPKSLMRQAQEATEKGITETIKESLEVLTRNKACKTLRAMRGSCNIKLNTKESRKDRVFSFRKKK